MIHIRKNLMAQGKELRQELQPQVSQVFDELEKPAPDAAKLHGIADDVLKRITRITHSAIDQALALHATFSPEQRETLVTRGREIQMRAQQWQQGGGEKPIGPAFKKNRQ
jgi:hypothetical protein